MPSTRINCFGLYIFHDNIVCVIKTKGKKMGFLSIFTESTVMVSLAAFVFVVFAIRCLVSGVMGGTSALFRIAGTIVCAAVAYYFWRYSLSLSGPNMIDTFVFDAWADIKALVSAIF